MAKKDFNRAFNIALKYAFTPGGSRTNSRAAQTFRERTAGVYLIADERKF